MQPASPSSQTSAPPPPRPAGGPAPKKKTSGRVWLISATVMYVLCVPVAAGALVIGYLVGGSLQAIVTILAMMAIELYFIIVFISPYPSTPESRMVALVLMVVPLVLLLLSGLLALLKRKRAAAMLAIIAGCFYMGIGILAVFAGRAFLREAKEQEST